MAHFEHKPLLGNDSIRLILLQPSTDFSSRIYCSLSCTSLDECKNDIIDHYTALSYVWGELRPQEQIFLNGQTFYIGDNLFEALRDLRHEQRVRRIWIDAICINQLDVKERNKQVALMGSIYGLAQHTIIYLGPATAESQTVFQVLRQSKVELPQPLLRKNIMQLVEHHILSRPWFSRVWILQELVLSRDPWIQCGRCRMKWDEFCSNLAIHSQQMAPETAVTPVGPIHCYNRPPCFQRDQNAIQQGSRVGQTDYHEVLRGMHAIRQDFQLYVCGGQRLLQIKPPSLLKVLILRRGFGVKDPKDMVFGHLGFVDVAYPSSETQTECLEDEKSLVHINYSKPEADVYIDAARSFIRQSGSLLVLSQAGSINPSLCRADLPSWVPDWKSAFPVKPINNEVKDPPEDSDRLKLAKNGRWTNDHPVHTIWPRDTSILTFDGYMMDVIECTTPVIPCYDANVDRRLEAFISSARIIAGERSHTKRQQNLLWCETYNEWRKKPGFEFLKPVEDYALEKNSLISSELFKALLSSKNLKTEAFPLEAQLVCHCRVHSDILTGRRIAAFQNGGIGVVPSSARAGDFICSEYKDGMKLVLRRRQQQDRNETFDEEIMSEFDKYYKAQRTTPAEMANSVDGVAVSQAANAEGALNPSHVSYIGECYYPLQERHNLICLCIFVVH